MSKELKCSNCYFWHSEIGCTIGSRKKPEDCNYANFEMYWDEDKCEAVWKTSAHPHQTRLIKNDKNNNQ